jgi:hypothetical protein
VNSISDGGLNTKSTPRQSEQPVKVSCASGTVNEEGEMASEQQCRI